MVALTQVLVPVLYWQFRSWRQRNCVNITILSATSLRMAYVRMRMGAKYLYLELAKYRCLALELALDLDYYRYQYCPMPLSFRTFSY